MPFHCNDNPECEFRTGDRVSLLHHRKRRHGYIPRSGGQKNKISKKNLKHVPIRLIRAAEAVSPGSTSVIASQFFTFNFAEGSASGSASGSTSFSAEASTSGSSSSRSFSTEAWGSSSSAPLWPPESPTPSPSPPSSSSSSSTLLLQVQVTSIVAFAFSFTVSCSFRFTTTATVTSSTIFSYSFLWRKRSIYFQSRDDYGSYVRKDLLHPSYP